jgi:hypothetical protein
MLAASSAAMSLIWGGGLIKALLAYMLGGMAGVGLGATLAWSLRQMAQIRRPRSQRPKRPEPAEMQLK